MHIYTHYPHPHDTVSTILLLFLSLLLHNVFSQESSDKNENCTFGEEIHPDVSRVPRVGCTAQSCLNCTSAKAECLHNTTSNAFTCTADTSECFVQVCDPCQYCSGVFSSPTTSRDFTLHSVCFDLPHYRTCQELDTSEQCVLNGNISSLDDIFAEFTWPNTGGNGDSIHLTCRCYGENCTEHLLYTYSILPTPSPIIVQESAVTMETASFLTIPTTSFLMIPTTSFLITPTPDIGVGNGKCVTFPIWSILQCWVCGAKVCSSYWLWTNEIAGSQSPNDEQFQFYSLTGSPWR